MEIQAVKGTHDLIGKDALKMSYVESVFSAVATLYGYQEIRLPIIEHASLFNHGTGEGSDVVRKEMYTFNDKGGRLLALRPEFTADVVRAIISNKLYAKNDLPLRYFYHGPAFRYERPQAGRYREFNQFGIEAIGLDHPMLDVEVILMAVQAFTMLGFEHPIVYLNSLGDEETRKKYREALISYFEPLLPDMCEDCHERFKINPLRMLDCKVPSDHELALKAPKLRDYLSEESQKRLELARKVLEEEGIEYRIDEQLVRGLDYYGEVVFEIQVENQGNRLALGGGGHYGKMVKELGGPDLAGVGFAIGLERVMDAMEKEGLFANLDDSLDLYLFPLGKEALAKTPSLALRMRALGYSTLFPYEETKLSTLFKKAEKAKARYGLIYGENELKNGTVQLRDLKNQAQKEIAFADLEETLDHLLLDEEESHEH